MKTKFKYVLTGFALGLFLNACNFDEKPEGIDESLESIQDDRIQLVLGEKLKNPFTLENMSEALSQLEVIHKNDDKRLNCTSCELNLGPTHKYVKFMPQNLDQMVTLETSGYNLWDYPLDQEITTLGDYYHDPAVGPDGITYFYTLIPTNYAITINVPHVIVSNLFLFNEDDGDILDEDDPWEPTPPPMPCFPTQPGDCVVEKKEKINNTIEATNMLDQIGVDRLELYNKAMEISGNFDEIIPMDERFGANARIQNVSGTIKVRDNSINADVPVRDALVKARRWFKLDQTFTSPTGTFTMRKNYRKKAVVSVHFSKGDKIRGINNVFKFYQFVIPVSKTIGMFTTAQLTNVQYTFPYVSSPNTNAATQWVAAHTWNTVKDNQFKNSQNGVNYNANNLNIWVSSRVTSANGSAPMLRAISNTSLVSLGIDIFLAHTTGPIGVAAKQILQNLLPDITLRYGTSSSSTMNTSQIKETIYHEMGHATHYMYVGNNYWTSFIDYIVSHNGYGTKTTSGSGRIAVAEGWGFYIGKLYASQYYGGIGTTNSNFISQNFIAQLELRKPSDTDEFVYWIPYGMFYDLTDTGEPLSTLVIDNVNAYSPGMIFTSLWSNVLSVSHFRNDLLQRSGNTQSAQVNQLVQSYGY